MTREELIDAVWVKVCSPCHDGFSIDEVIDALGDWVLENTGFTLEDRLRLEDVDD